MARLSTGSKPSQFCQELSPQINNFIKGDDSDKGINAPCLT